MNSLFPDEELLPKLNRPVKSKSISYEDFVAKFSKKTVKTTDDCYTPKVVYDAVLRWLGEKVDLKGRAIVRPFYPGGDYVNEEYLEGCVVVDNPPFSILTKIVRFYVAHKIDFFLFAPTLTLFSAAFGSDICYLVTNCNIIYHNNASVHTSFLTSLFPGVRVILANSLTAEVNDACGKKTRRAVAAKVAPPRNIVTAARLTKYIGGGGEMWLLWQTKLCL